MVDASFKLRPGDVLGRGCLTCAGAGVVWDGLTWAGTTNICAHGRSVERAHLDGDASDERRGHGRSAGRARAGILNVCERGRRVGRVRLDRGAQHLRAWTQQTRLGGDAYGNGACGRRLRGWAK